MKIIILEATAEELSANKRVADAIVDALTRACDNISRLPWSNFEDDEEIKDDEEVKADDDR